MFSLFSLPITVSGVPVANGSIALTLIGGPATIISTGGAAPNSYIFNLDGSGNPPAIMQAWGNAELSPGGTQYTYAVWSGANGTGSVVIGPFTSIVGPSAPYSGTLYPNLTVLPLLSLGTINGVNVTGTPSANQVLTATSGTAATWQTPSLSGTTLNLNGSTSGTTQVKASAVASGILTMPAVTDQLVGRGTTDTLIGKTISTSGSGNHIQIAAADLPTAVGASNTFLGTTDGAAVTFSNPTRASLAADAKGWQFLGTATGSGVTVGPVTTTSTFQQFMIKYQIKGYSGGTPVGRFLCGAASISTTALTNSFTVEENIAAVTTGAGATAIPGLPLAQTLSNTQRSGTILIDGASGAVKVLDVIGNEQSPSVATAPTLFRGSSFFSDLGTNLPLQRFQLTSYDTLTAVAASSNTFVSGTYLTVWARNND
jgi:hypothetical protein